MEYTLYAALREDVNSGWVWINTPTFRQRAVICIENTGSKKKVFCEVLQIEENFIAYYNMKGQRRIFIRESNPSIVLNQWYRKKLGDLSTKSKYELSITNADTRYGKVMACIHHPQVMVRVATWLGLISVVLGIFGIVFGVLGVVLGFASLYK